MPVFADRDDAGRALVAPLSRLLADAEPPADRPILLPLPRGGVPVAARIADELQLPMCALPVRKVGVPGHQELAMGALARLGDTTEVMRHEAVISACRVSPAVVDSAIAAESDALRGLLHRYYGDQAPPDLHGRYAIVVDDGLATGATMTAAVRLVRRAGALRVVVAVPVGSASARARLAAEADDVLCLREPTPFSAVSIGYRRFGPPSDDSVLQALRRHAEAG
jgi:putative phosphoribosyl transferase